MKIQDINRISYRLSKEICQFDFVEDFFVADEVLEIIQNSFSEILEEELEQHVEIQEEEE